MEVESKVCMAKETTSWVYYVSGSDFNVEMDYVLDEKVDEETMFVHVVVN